jgi:hypothetical protein
MRAKVTSQICPLAWKRGLAPKMRSPGPNQPAAWKACGTQV